jgi:hypothetical protein
MLDVEYTTQFFNSVKKQFADFALKLAQFIAFGNYLSHNKTITSSTHPYTRLQTVFGMLMDMSVYMK